jgi:hypothetical protein
MCQILAIAVALSTASCISPLRADEPAAERHRYLRQAKEGVATECTFEIARDAKGWTITSMTDRGATKMAVVSQYDAQDRLLNTSATLTSGKSKTPATVNVADGKATIKRDDANPQQFDVPAGVIVTSAPDWTDVFLLCRRYDKAGKANQEFPALWIHPTQPAQRLTFAIERQGTDSIDHAGKKSELTRFLITIRGGSRYAAWADSQGKMIRLIPMPANDPTTGLTLEGFEKSAASLRLPR